ncbi:MAG: inorganic diphosphatase [Maricaulaceae bacterium]|nr:inorganic diphosphatase [Maricaulaceae bacterium]
MNLDRISAGENPPDDVNMIVEVPLGGDPVKYELDKASGVLVVDRFLHTAMRYPCNYGFIPHTLSEDGDPADVLCLGTSALIPGSLVRVRPIGVLLMKDEKGPDEKILAAPHASVTSYYDAVKDHTDVPPALLARITHFFEHYKDLEPGKWVKVSGWGDAALARTMIEKAIAAAKG